MFNGSKLKRVVTKYSKQPPYEQVAEYEIFCSPGDMHHLFDVGDDQHMIYVYKLKTQEQIDFFKNLGVPIDPDERYFYVESYEE